MARKTSDEPTGQTVDETPTARTATTGDSSGGEEPAVDAGMRHETHGELPSERPPADF